MLTTSGKGSFSEDSFVWSFSTEPRIRVSTLPILFGVKTCLAKLSCIFLNYNTCVFIDYTVNKLPGNVNHGLRYFLPRAVQTQDEKIVLCRHAHYLKSEGEKKKSPKAKEHKITLMLEDDCFLECFNFVPVCFFLFPIFCFGFG